MLSALKNLQEGCSQLGVTLNRDWPPAFQTARYLRAKVENLEKDVDGIRNVKWKRSELQKNYYYLWQRVRDLGSEADNVRRMDERDIADIQALEKEYQNGIRDHAHRVYAGNEAGIRKEIASGEAYLKSLVDQHKAGRKNGTNTPSALEVKTLLQRKIDAYKQQLLDYNVARMDDASHEMERGRQFMSTGKEVPVPINRTEFITTIFRLTTDLQKLSRQHPDIEDAIEELRLAHAESRKSKPASTELKRLMNSAKGILVDVEKTVPEVAPVIGAITMMTGVIKNIFG
jgi:hypothetical protein